MANLSGSEKNRRDGVQTSLESGISLRERVRQATRQIESELILEALEQHRWNRRRTAEALRISYRLLMYKMKSCNLRAEGAVGRSVAS
jgi:DNA-binding NtrC family response regulator